MDNESGPSGKKLSYFLPKIWHTEEFRGTLACPLSRASMRIFCQCLSISVTVNILWLFTAKIEVVRGPWKIRCTHIQNTILIWSGRIVLESIFEMSDFTYSNFYFDLVSMDCFGIHIWNVRHVSTFCVCMYSASWLAPVSIDCLKFPPLGQSSVATFDRMKSNRFSALNILKFVWKSLFAKKSFSWEEKGWFGG